MDGQNPFLFESELPGPQPTSQASTGAGGGGLLDFLGGIISAIPYFSAGLQAAQGKPEYSQMLRERERQQNLFDQLQQMSQQEMEGPFGETLKRQLQFGDVQGAQKTLANIPRYKQVQSLAQDPKLGLSPEDQAAIQSISAVDPQIGLDLVKRYTGEKAVAGRQRGVLEETFKRREALEEKKMARQEAKLPGNVVARAIESGEVTADDLPGIVGVLQASGVKLPANESEARIFASRILNSPKIKKMIPAKEQKSWLDSISGMFTRKPQPAPAVQQAPAMPQLPPGFTIERVGK